MNKNFILALVGIGIGGIGFGLITPVTIVLLENAHAPSWLIGSSTMVGYLSVVIFSNIAGKAIDKYNVRKVLLVGLTVWMIGAALHVFWYIYWLLYIINFVMGVGGTFVFVATEVTINSYSDDSNRGKNIGLYVILLSLGIAVGTLLVWTIKFGDWVPFTIGSVIMLIVLFFQYIFFEPIYIKSINEKIERLSIKNIPLIGLTSSLVYGLFESSVVVALPIFGLRNSFSNEQVSLFLASYVVGGVVLGFLLSKLSDKVSKYHLLIAIALFLALFFILPAFFMNYIFLLIIFFVIGGIVPAFYTVGLNYTIEKVDRAFMAQANGYYIMMYGTGTILGPMIGAELVELNKQFGFWVFSAILCLVFAVYFKFFLLRRKQ